MGWKVGTVIAINANSSGPMAFGAGMVGARKARAGMTTYLAMYIFIPNIRPKLNPFEFG